MFRLKTGQTEIFIIHTLLIIYWIIFIDDIINYSTKPCAFLHSVSSLIWTIFLHYLYEFWQKPLELFFRILLMTTQRFSSGLRSELLPGNWILMILFSSVSKWSQNLRKSGEGLAKLSQGSLQEKFKFKRNQIIFNALWNPSLRLEKNIWCLMFTN